MKAQMCCQHRLNLASVPCIQAPCGKVMFVYKNNDHGSGTRGQTRVKGGDLKKRRRYTQPCLHTLEEFKDPRVKNCINTCCISATCVPDHTNNMSVRLLKFTNSPKDRNMATMICINGAGFMEATLVLYYKKHFP